MRLVHRALVLLAPAVVACADQHPRRREPREHDSAELPAGPHGSSASATSASARASARSELTLIGGAEVDEQALIDAPMVAIKDGELRVDDELVVKKPELAALADKLQRVEPLFVILRDKRNRWKEFQPNKAFPGVVIMDVEESTPAVLVKSMFQTAAYAGYPNVKFVVQKLPAAAPSSH